MLFAKSFIYAIDNMSATYATKTQYSIGKIQHTSIYPYKIKY